MQQSITAIHSAARAIPQAYADLEQHSLAWRILLQCIRNAVANTTEPKDRLLARVFQATLDIFCVSGDEPYAAQKNALLDAITAMAKRLEFEAVVPSGDELPAITGPNGEVLAEAE
jgi:hypothetical protein